MKPLPPETPDMSEVGPSKILAFDSARRNEPEPVDLESPFFKVVHPSYPECSHRDRGVTLDVGTRKAICLCGVEIDCFDALMIYAHAQQRLVHTRQRIDEHYEKEREKKAKRPFVRDLDGFFQCQSKSGRFLYYEVTLSPCGHKTSWSKRKLPRRMTCEQCYKNAQLQESGVATVEGAKASPAGKSDLDRQKLW